MLIGGCLCGSVRYEADDNPFHETTCHCSMCRRASAAPFVAWFSVPRASFRFVAGDPTRYRSSGKATRSFCPGCGTQLTFEHDDFADEVDVTTCSLDDPDAVPPKDHTHTSRRLRWIGTDDGLPEYRDARSDG